MKEDNILKQKPIDVNREVEKKKARDAYQAHGHISDIMDDISRNDKTDYRAGKKPPKKK